jgi:hypothetical protein
VYEILIEIRMKLARLLTRACKTVSDAKDFVFTGIFALVLTLFWGPVIPIAPYLECKSGLDGDVIPNRTVTSILRRYSDFNFMETENGHRECFSVDAIGSDRAIPAGYERVLRINKTLDAHTNTQLTLGLCGKSVVSIYRDAKILFSANVETEINQIGNFKKFVRLLRLIDIVLFVVAIASSLWDRTRRRNGA